MPRFTRQSVKIWCRSPVIGNRLALENDHNTGSNTVQYSVDAYKPKSICKDTLTGTVRSKYTAIEGENRKLDTANSRRVEYWDNIRSLLLP